MMSEKLQKMNKVMNEAARAYVTAYNDGDSSRKALQALKTKAMEAVKAYNLQLAEDTYLAWNKEGDPVRIAIRQRTVPGAVKAVFRANDDDIMSVKFSDAELEVSLLQMQAVLGKSVFHEENWFDKVTSLHYLIVDHIYTRMGSSPEFQYGCNPTKWFSFEGYDPLSAEGSILALQEVFDSILFIPEDDGSNMIKMSSFHTPNGDVATKEFVTIRESVSCEGGVNSVAVCNNAKFANLIMRAMHGILTNGSFSLYAVGDNVDLNEHIAEVSKESDGKAEAKTE